jgi:hypothetical protein
MRFRFPIAFVCIAMAAACGGGTPAPAGWQPVPGATGQWTTGTGAAEQRYSYEKSPFVGSLQTLGSQVAVDAVARDRSAKFLKSDVFTPCPGIAAVATFSLSKARTLDEGFSAKSDHAVLVRYEHPAHTAMDQSVAAAMERALCPSS